MKFAKFLRASIFTEYLQTAAGSNAFNKTALEMEDEQLLNNLFSFFAANQFFQEQHWTSWKQKYIIEVTNAEVINPHF